jgi:hypothetical protein
MVVEVGMLFPEQVCGLPASPGFGFMAPRTPLKGVQAVVVAACVVGGGAVAALEHPAISTSTSRTNGNFLMSPAAFLVQAYA